jgi:hypothetical protein
MVPVTGAMKKAAGYPAAFSFSVIETLNQRLQEIPITWTTRRIASNGLAYLCRACRAVYVALRLVRRETRGVEGQLAE